MRCFTPEQDALYARGWPHVVVLDDDTTERKPSLAKLYKKYLGVFPISRWPRAMAHALVRACTAIQTGAIATWQPTGTATDTAPITIADARAAIARQLGAPRRRSYVADEHLVLCIEALIGPDAALELIVDALAGLPRERWPRPGDPFDPDAVAMNPNMAPQIHRANVLYENSNVGSFAYLAGYLLLRASNADARARLEALWQATTDAGAIAGEETLRGGLDLALHGSDAMRRLAPWSHWQYLYCWGLVDDEALLRARFAARDKAQWDPDPRHVWSCPALVDVVFRKPVLRALGDRRLQFLENVGMFDHPAVVALMRDWAADKKSGAFATRWLAEHA